MAGFAAQGATFTFGAVKATITRVSVEAPVAEIVDMTAIGTSASQTILVPTGVLSGGSMEIDYIASSGGADPQSVIGKVGDAKFDSSGFSVTKRAVCESATKTAAVGQLVTGTMRFRITDYTQTDSIQTTNL